MIGHFVLFPILDRFRIQQDTDTKEGGVWRVGGRQRKGGVPNRSNEP